MHVAMYYSNQDVRLEEVPMPQIGRGEVLIRVEASGICGTDLLEWYRLHRAPLVLGHEIAGAIEAVGEGVKNYKEGDRICAAHHVPCNTCQYCLKGHFTACETLHTTNYDPGGFAEFVRVPAINVLRGTFRLPDSMSWDDATFIEPVACTARGQRALEPLADTTVLVLGSGIAGLLHVALSKAAGAARVIATDIAPARLELAKSLGADDAIDAREDVPARVRHPVAPPGDVGPRGRPGWLARTRRGRPAQAGRPLESLAQSAGAP